RPPRELRRAAVVFVMKIALVFLLACAGCGCRSGVPVHEWRTDAGLARADSIERARALAELAEELAPAVCALLEVPMAPPFVLLFDSELDHHGLRVWRDGRGRIVDRRIELGPAVLEQLRFAVTHELVHWYRQGI